MKRILAVTAVLAMSACASLKMGVYERDGVKSMNTNQDLAQFEKVPPQEQVTECGKNANAEFWGHKSDKQKFGNPNLIEGITFRDCLVAKGNKLKAGK